MAITTMDGLVSAIAAGQIDSSYEATVTTQAAGYLCSLWTGAGRPGAGATPASGAGAVPTNTTAGALPLPTISGSNTLYLGKLAFGSTTLSKLILIDRLCHTAGLSGTSTSAQTVNSTALTRNYTGTGTTYANALFLEWYTATGSTGTTATISYTNQAGTSGQSASVTLPASVKAATVLPVQLAAGDYGIESVQSVTLAASTGTAGSFGVTLAWKLATAAIPTGTGYQAFDYSQVGMPAIVSGACLSFYVHSTSTTTGTIETELSLVQG